MERTFHKKLVNQLFRYRIWATETEYTELKDEASTYVETIKDYPMSKQHLLFIEKYGGMLDFLKKNEEIQLLNSINKTLNFFKLLAILSIIFGIIALFFTFAS